MNTIQNHKIFNNKCNPRGCLRKTDLLKISQCTIIVSTPDEVLRKQTSTSNISNFLFYKLIETTFPENT